MLLMNFCFLIGSVIYGNTIIVKNIGELNEANKKAQPGDIIILANGEWKDVTILLTCNGTSEKPIIFKAEEAGKVIITGQSKLKLGGNYITVDGFYFTRGYAGNDAIIKFSMNASQIANHCRVTNTVIKNYNNPKRLDENYWVAFYGKHNRIDHCSFFDKKNMGVMMAVILDDERSRENFHSIDHNYFGFRLPLASNTGETIRVGVSQHCEFNSNTIIADNFFEYCDGETEIISIKSGSNIIRNNLFKECQGAVVLRHGDNNTVENNIFLGNNKEGTGGVRVINKGQWVVNNLFYRCRGTSFRSPLSIMNGVPNSPANRYVSAGDAVIANNSFFECTPVTFCEGSDEERSEAPDNIHLLNNIFYNKADSFIYKYYDDTKGFRFAGNRTNNLLQQSFPGFIQSDLTTQSANDVSIPNAPGNAVNPLTDSIQAASQKRLGNKLSSTPGFSDFNLLKTIETNAYNNCGAKWYAGVNSTNKNSVFSIDCKSSSDIVKAISDNPDKNISINLTGRKYKFDSPVIITTNVKFNGSTKRKIRFSTDFGNADYLIMIKAGNAMTLNNLNLNLKETGTRSFISTDTSGSSDHSNIIIKDCSIANLKRTFFNAAKTSVADSITIENCSFKNNKSILFDFNSEDDKKGYYNVEKLSITNNKFRKHKGQLLAMLRSGNDESTMGPHLIFKGNVIQDCQTTDNKPLIYMYGTQRSNIESNIFRKCNLGKQLLQYDDLVRAVHHFRNNIFSKSGSVIKDDFVIEENNIIQ